jgi:hypothetical protein
MVPDSDKPDEELRKEGTEIACFPRNYKPLPAASLAAQ